MEGVVDQCPCLGIFVLDVKWVWGSEPGWQGSDQCIVFPGGVDVGKDDLLQSGINCKCSWAVREHVSVICFLLSFTEFAVRGVEFV